MKHRIQSLMLLSSFLILAGCNNSQTIPSVSESTTELLSVEATETPVNEPTTEQVLVDDTQSSSYEIATELTEEVSSTKKTTSWDPVFKNLHDFREEFSEIIEKSHNLLVYRYIYYDSNILRDNDFGVMTEYKSLKEERDCMGKAIDNEMNALLSYQDKGPVDQKITEIISDYIEALESEKEGLDYYFTDNTQFYQKYYLDGWEKRKDCLIALGTTRYRIPCNLFGDDDLWFFKRIECGERVKTYAGAGMGDSYTEATISIDDAVETDWGHGKKNNVGDDKKVIVLKFSYTGGFSELKTNSIDASRFFSVLDCTYTKATPWDGTKSVKDYQIAPSGVFEKYDHVTKVAIPYVVDDDTEYIKIVMAPFFETVIKVGKQENK